MSQNPTTPYVLPPLGQNPSSTAAGTTPGSFAKKSQIAPGVEGRWTFASPDTPGMPQPSEKTAWDFMPEGWVLLPHCEHDHERPESWLPPEGFQPSTQLEHARLGIITPEMKRDRKSVV